jgi:S-adenosylmethionine:tRNA ribosyltransferase-isomerase
LPELLREGDLLVANDTRVMAARLFATRATGGRVELVLLEKGPNPVHALVRNLRRLRDGEVLRIDGDTTVTVVDRQPDGVCRVAFNQPVEDVMAAHGAPPLPPYLDRAADPSDRERYQTVYAGALGAAAAPTAGLHFDKPLIETLVAKGIGWTTVTLHVGLGTFRPLKDEDLDAGVLHEEQWHVSHAAAAAVARTRASGGRVIAVGTTAVRTLEASTRQGSAGPLPGSGATRIFIQPGYRFRSIDGLITNFHLPRSSLLMLVAAFTGIDPMRQAYGEAIQRGYRFYSYGDAMLLL